MWDKIRSLVSNNNADQHTQNSSVGTAVAALLVYTASLDHDYSAEERERILDILQRQQWDTQTSPEALLIEGETLAQEALDCYGFLRVLGSDFSEQDRLQLLEMMWQVVIEDGVLDEYETNMMRRIAGLLGISDQDSGRIRRAVLNN